MRRHSLFFLSLVIGLGGCDDASKRPAAPAVAGVGLETRFPLAIGAATLNARVALTDLELATGLMNTRVLPKDEGMIFSYRNADRRAFWMKNVPYDIDIGFFDAAGKLTQVALLKAENLEPVETNSPAIRYAVEAPAGWFAAHGLNPGAPLDLCRLAKAVRERGFDEKAFVDTE